MAKNLKITNKIRRLRFFADEMTQLDLAEKVGCSRQTIIALEAGKYTPSLELAFRIALAFNVPIGDVFRCDPIGDSVSGAGA
ncbi:MAG: helix-turn-helix transcriptional regulator [Bifidobacteriaceae bacterium]|jgi:putative transcriptional regulator|nr:helix-turn-helix transcriptional regulator [Bifidobacteriaceae bacterium]